jgi:phosphoadenosine phosphosulfate reductase
MTNEMKSFEQQQKLWNDQLRTKTPSEIILWAIKEFTPGSLFQTTAFGATGMVIRDMIYKVQHGECGKDQIPLIFIDTLYRMGASIDSANFFSDFKETLDLVERVKSKYDNIPVNIFKPDGCETVQDFESKFGQKLWEIDGDKYEYVTKAEPGHRACLNLGARAVFTERRKSQGADGANLHIIELDFARSPPLVKINPLVDWDYEQVWSYINENSVPYNILHYEEYKSIGDTHSTVPTKAGQSEREGRWGGQAKTECGLHKDYFKLKQAAASSNLLSIKGPFLLHNVWKGLKLNAAHLQTIKSIDYSFSTGINVILSSSISLIPPKIEHSLIESDYTHLDKFVVTIISSSPLTYQNIARILDILKLIFSAKPLHTSASEVYVLELQIGIRKEEFGAIALELFKLSQIEKIDLNIQEESVFRKHKRLVIFDMDSTLIQQEVIDELAREAGVFDKISAITESAMY